MIKYRLVYSITHSKPYPLYLHQKPRCQCTVVSEDVDSSHESMEDCHYRESVWGGRRGTMHIEKILKNETPFFQLEHWPVHNRHQSSTILRNCPTYPAPPPITSLPILLPTTPSPPLHHPLILLLHYFPPSPPPHPLPITSPPHHPLQGTG